ncbi:MAG: methanogenesis marker 8 protein [Candidatus Omnitrophota bacterium]
MNSLNKRDIHVLKYFSSFVSVSGGKVINITEPTLKFCPLAKYLYKGFNNLAVGDNQAIKSAIKSAIESKIKDYGFFTEQRKLSYEDVAIPYGASEMLMYALRQNVIDAAVVVCEGAGTVITEAPEIVQGIGARMNSLLLTSPIKSIMEKLKSAGCRIVSENAIIDQFQGVKQAIKAGYKNIAVTVSGNSAENLKKLRLLEKENNVKIILLAICTTGIVKDKIKMIGDYADLVWSCASFDLRQMVGPLALMQLSKLIPVFVLTQNGVNFVSAYAKESEIIKNLDLKKQYLFSKEDSAQSVHLGKLKVFISEAKLPVEACNEIGLKNKNVYASA